MEYFLNIQEQNLKFSDFNFFLFSQKAVLHYTILDTDLNSKTFMFLTEQFETRFELDKIK